MTWREALAEEGISVDVVDRNHVTLVDETTSSTLLVVLRSFPRPLSASKLPPRPAGAGLLVVPRGTEAFVRSARERGWFVAAGDGTLDVAVGQRRIHRRPSATSPVARRRPGRVPWPLWTTARVMACLSAGGDGPEIALSQQRLAELVGTSQPTAHRAIKRLGESGLVRSASGRIGVPDHAGLLDWWLANYPGPGGLTSYWYSLDAPVMQARAALVCLDRARADPVLSGEVAADALAPWQRPRRVQIYARAGTSLTNAGFVPVPNEAAATLCLTVPEDPGLWLPDQWLVRVEGGRVPVADPMQVLWDVAAAAGPASSEAATHLRRALTTTLADRWRRAGSTGRRYRNPTDVRPPVVAPAGPGPRS